MILRAVQVKCIVEFFHIVQSAFCGIVGNVIRPAADGLNVAEKIRTSLIQGIAYGNGAVDIEQEKLFILQTSQLCGIAVNVLRVKSIHNYPHF